MKCSAQDGLLLPWGRLGALGLGCREDSLGGLCFILWVPGTNLLVA